MKTASIWIHFVLTLHMCKQLRIPYVYAELNDNQHLSEILIQISIISNVMLSCGEKVREDVRAFIDQVLEAFKSSNWCAIPRNPDDSQMLLLASNCSLSPTFRHDQASATTSLSSSESLPHECQISASGANRNEITQLILSWYIEINEEFDLLIPFNHNGDNITIYWR